MQDSNPVTSIDFAAGELRVRGWPAPGPRAPFGLWPSGSELRGPARTRWPRQVIVSR